MTLSCLHDENGTTALTVYVQPRASRDRVAGLHDGAVKMCVTAPPVEGKANAAVGHFLAKLFHVSKSAVVLHSGRQNRTKKFLLRGLSLAEAEKILEKYL